MNHEENINRVKEFLFLNYEDAWCPKEIANALGINVKIAKNICKKLFKGGLLKRSPVKVNCKLSVGKNRTFPIIHYWWRMADNKEVNS